MKHRILIALGLLVCYSTSIFAQNEVYSSDSLLFIDDRAPRHLNHPMLLVQGKIPGLSVYQDRNPNGRINYRIRGFNRLQDIRPLIIVDGIAEADQDFLNPNEIVSIKVRKSLAESSIYGLRGADGVIEIQTNQFNSHTLGSDYIDANYSTYFARSAKSNTVPVMNRETFIAAGGNDLGGNTNWQDEVSRTGISGFHQLGISGKQSSFRYSAKVSLEKREGVLDKSGFDRKSLRFGVSNKSFDDRLLINANGYLSARNEDRSFVEGFRYATVYNPTAPIRFENGEYFEAILFDNFNPAGIIGQNLNEAEREENGGVISVLFLPIDGLSIQSSYSLSNQNNFHGQYYSPRSFFRGLNRNGLVIRTDSYLEYESFRNEARYSIPLNKSQLELYAGYNSWQKKESFTELESSNFNEDPEGYTIGMNQAQYSKNSSYQSPTLKNSTFYLGGLFHKQSVTVDSRVRRESYNVLGSPNESDWFGDVIADIDFKELTKFEPTDELWLRFSASKTATYPGFFGAALAQSTFDRTAQTERFTRDPNSDLVISTVDEKSLGLRTKMADNTVEIGIEYYRRNVKGVLIKEFIPANESITGAAIRYGNELDLSSNGLEAIISYVHQFENTSSYETRFIISSSKVMVDHYIIDKSLRASPGAPGQGSTQLIRLAVGEEVGQIWGPVFDRVAREGETETLTYGGGQTYTYTYSAGEPIFKDVNGDGIKKTAMFQALDEDTDFTVIGNAYPDFEFGWTNTYQRGNLFAEAHFRGAIGHSKVNLNRMFYEPIDQGAINSYNRVNSDKAAQGLTQSYYSSLFVERADFITLDYLTLGYMFDLTKLKRLKAVQLSATLEDVFTITKYTGVSPDPVFDDFGPVDNGGFLNTTADPLSPGIDRRTNYLPARTILIGARLEF
ncbi:MAG: TonB-dependent receptor plug domain-containing protein [Balneolaceae bacterium]|nr:TonB-dependent receptor plug domain-containing protein [Balneolaceae bacterium]